MMPYTQTTPNAIMPDIREYMTTKEAALMLGFHVNSITKMIASKRLEAVKFGRTWLVSRKSVAKYLELTKGMKTRDPRRHNLD